MMRSNQWFERIALVALTALGAGACGGQNDLEEGLEPPLEKAVEPITASFNGHDYSFYMTPDYWWSALTSCVNVGHLVSIGSAQENAFVTGQMAQHGGGTWWIGFNDQTTEGTFKWHGNDPVTYTNWNAGEPNNWGNEDAVTLDSTTGKWNDLSDSAGALPFACERDSGPQPATISPWPYSANDTNSATRNVMQLQIFVNTNEGLTVGTCGVPGASSSGDTFLRLYKPGNTVQIAYNDDACGGIGSNISIIAPTSGWYVVRAGCFDDAACSGVLTARREPQAPPHHPQP